MGSEHRYGAVISETAHFLPERIVTNAEIEQYVDTSDEWIRERTGIVERRFLTDDEPTSRMAAEVAKSLIEKSGVDPLSIDLVYQLTH